jgi:hypothetical protein
VTGLGPLTLRVLPETLAICRLAPSEPVPAWAASGAFGSVTRTPTELSIVSAEAATPPGVAAERGWRAIAVDGPLDFGLTGVLASLAAPLAGAQISIFSVSTFDTDYILVREAALARAVDALARAGHRFEEGRP